jgi:hypothetical protein
MKKTNLVLALSICALLFNPPMAARAAHAAGAVMGCRTGSPLASVTDPARFKVLARCVSLTGTVRSIAHAQSGAYQVTISPDIAFRGVLSTANKAALKGNLLLEITASDAARGVRPMAIGTHVYVVGSLLLNMNHGWNELYPVWVFKPASAAPKKLPGSGYGSHGGQSGGGQGGGNTGGSNSAPDQKKFFVIVAVTPKVMHHGYSHALATVLTAPGAHCDAALTYAQATNPLGALFGMGGQDAPADGKITWTWALDYNIFGDGAITVTCSYQGVTVKAVGKFTIVQ